MTAQTISYLKNTDFPLTGTPGRINPQGMWDLSDTLAARTAFYYVNAPEYGAVGNGSSNPASTKYSTLAALQAFYGVTVGGVAIALTNELDWLAHQRAIDVATTNGGAIISSSAFSYVFSNTHSVADGSGTLNFPAVNSITPGNAVSWVGENQGGCNMSWPVDLGTGRFAVLCGGRASNQSVGEFSNLVFTGPPIGSTLNAHTCNMQCIGTNDRREINKCSITSFYIGTNVVGGQCLWYDVHIFNCFYNMYWDDPQVDNYGDIVMLRCVLEGALKADIGVHPNSVVTGVTFLGCFLGSAPFSFFKETGGTNNLIIGECWFTNCQFEGVGNSVFSDDQTPTTRVAILVDTHFVRCEVTWDVATWNIPALPQFALWDIQEMDYVIFDAFRDPDNWQPGTGGMFNINFMQGVVFQGDVMTLLANCTAASLPFMVNPGGWSGVTFDHIGGANGQYRWSGQLGQAADTVQVAGEVVIQATTGGFPLGTKVSAGATTDTPLGVLMYNPTPGSTGGNVVVADHGIVPVKSSGAITQGKWVRTTSAGAVIVASSSADVTTPMIGIALTAASGNICLVKLKGLS